MDVATRLEHPTERPRPSPPSQSRWSRRSHRPPGHAPRGLTSPGHGDMERLVIVLAVLTGLLAACGGEPTTAVPTGTRPPTTTATIPPSVAATSPVDGEWRSGKMTEDVFTRAAVKIGGASITQAHDLWVNNLAADRFIVVTMQFKDGQFTEFESVDGGSPSVGNEETYEVNDDILDLRGSGEESGCVARFHYKVEDDTLTLQFAGTVGTCPPPPHFGAALYASGPYTRVD
jgi:hypothetical protein